MNVRALAMLTRVGPAPTRWAAKHGLLGARPPLTTLTLTRASAAADAMEAVKQGSACVGCRVRVIAASCVQRLRARACSTEVIADP